MKHYRTISIDLKKPLDFEVRLQNDFFLTEIVKYLICGFILEISTWKLFFRKVWMILNIFHIYDIFSKWIFIDVELNEVALKIVIFCSFHLQKSTSGLTELTVVREGIGEFYPSYTNSEKERFVCRPSRTQGIHDGYDPKMQAVKLADVFGIEKIWASLYECNRQHGDFDTKRSTILPWA